MSWPRPRATLGVKLALVLFGAVAGALAIVYLLVVPRLEDRVVDAKIRELERAMPSVVTQIRRSSFIELQDTVSLAAASVNARVVAFDRLGDEVLRPIADSSLFEAGGVSRDRVALEAAATFVPQAGRVEREDREFAEVALAVGDELVVLISAPLDDALAHVRLVRRSLIVAGLIALLVAAVGAYVAALGLTRRLRRLEAAADRIAHGDFGTPVDVRGGDEVAQLAHGFESMRLRLADLDRVRREFIANASHELRTPLFSLGGFLELLADEELDPDTRRDFLNETRAQVERLTRLATDLLDLSRLDAGQLQIRRDEVDLAEAARTLGDEFRAVAEASEHPLRVRADDPVRAVGDEQRILQIGRILVENALRHTPAGTAVEVTAGAFDGRARLSVRDEGPGIPAEEQEHVFERFYRASGGKASGSGLGLAIGSELAARMGGKLRIASRPGETMLELELGSTASPRENEPPAEAQLAGAGETRSG
jgi:signal transduction histidine kinase